jgi:hypothetical protein
MEAAKEIAAKVPGAELIIVQGLGHDLPAELVPTFADAINKAVQRATSPYASQSLTASIFPNLGGKPELVNMTHSLATQALQTLLLGLAYNLFRL